MPRFSVTVEFTEVKRRVIAIFARDPEQAREIAVERVEGWDGVVDADAIDVQEEP